MSILCPLTAICALLLITSFNIVADSSEAKRYTTGPQLKVQSVRCAGKYGKVVRASAPPKGKGKTWPASLRSNRMLPRSELRGLLEHLVVAAQHRDGSSNSGEISDEDTKESDHIWDGKDIDMDMDEVDMPPFSVLNLNRKGGRIRERERRAKSQG